MTTFGLQSDEESETETSEMTMHRPLIRTYQLDYQDHCMASSHRKIRALNTHSDSAQRIIYADENQAVEMSLETLGKDSAAELELEKDKYIALKRKFYELDEKSRALSEESVKLRMLYTQKLETFEKMKAKNADIEMEAANHSMDISIGENSLLAEQREAAQKQEKCAQLQNKIDSNALSAEMERNAREVERLTEHKEQIENRLMVSLDEKAAINYETLLKEKDRALDKAQKEIKDLQNKSNTLCKERDRAVEALSREREAWAMSMAAKDEALANIERNLKEKVIDYYVQQNQIDLSSQYIAY